MDGTCGRRPVTAPAAHIQIDLSAFRRNVSAVTALIGPACELLAVVKADGYGHGLVPMARAAIAGGARRLGVTTVEEGAALRTAGLSSLIVVMGIVDESEADTVVAHRLTPVITRSSQIAALAAAVRTRAGSPVVPLPVHLKVDTGMGRLGLTVDELWPALAQAQAAPELSVEGLMTHFAEADRPDSPYTTEQCGRFAALLDEVNRSANHRRSPVIGHAANSAALLTRPESRFQLVRSGLALYGVLPAPHCRGILPLEPVMTWKSRIAHLRRLPAGCSLGYGRTFVTERPSLIGLLPIGYAAGYPRLLSNRAACLHQGSRVPIAGRISMDLTMIDLTEHPSAAIGDEVVLLGRQDRAAITAEEFAKWAETIPYEILCGAGHRNPRRYLESADHREHRTDRPA